MAKRSGKAASIAAALAVGAFGVFLLAEIILRLSGAFLEFWASRAAEKAPYRRTILCEGDSFTYGLGGLEFPSQLEEILNARAGEAVYRVVNKGLPGMNTAVLADQLEGHIRAYRPDAVIVLAGEDNAWNTMGLDLGKGEAPFWSQIDRALLKLRAYKFVKLMAIGTRRDGFSRDRPAGGAAGAAEAGFPKDGFDLYLRAQKLEEERRLEEARGLYERFARMNPKHPAGYGKIASCFMKEERLKEAVPWFEKAVGAETAAESEMAHFEFGYALLRLNRGREAETTWREGLAKFPKSPQLFQALSRYLKDKGRLEEALALPKSLSDLQENSAYRALARSGSARGELRTGMRQFLAASKEGRERDELDRLISRGLYEDVVRIQGIARRAGVPLLFASYPDHAYPEVLAGVADSGGRFIDFRGIFKEKFKRREDYISDDDCHCNTAGYKVMAEVLAGEIEGLLGDKKP